MKKTVLIEKYWWPILALVGVAIYGLVMVLAANQSIWFDEGYSILLAKSSWGDLFALTAVDAHPPLYYALLKVWGSLFGFNEFALRSLSAFFLAGASVTGLLIVRKVFSAKVALYTIPFIIFAPFLLRYGYEVRMYSLALLIGVVATYVLIVAQQKQGWWRWVAYAALVALGMYTLYMTLVVWLAHAVWLLALSMKQKRAPLKEWKWLYAYGLSIVLFAAYIPTFIYQFVHSALPGVGNEITITRLVDMASVLFTYTPEWSLGGWLSLALLTAGILTGIVGTRVYKALPMQTRPYYVLLVLLVVVPIIFYTVTSLPPRTPIFINRYLAHIALFVYLLVGVTLALGIVGLTKNKGRSKSIPAIAYTLVVVILAYGTAQLYVTGNFVFERLQHPQTAQLRETIKCDDSTTVVADDPYTYIDAVFYFDGCNMRFFSKDAVERKGGYAPLSGSSARIESSTKLDTKTIVRLSWVGNEPQFALDSRYERISTASYDKQQVDTYRLIEE